MTATFQPLPALHPGDRVAVIAPASGFERDAFETGLEYIAGRYRAEHGSGLFELLAAADLALYRAKDAGRNQVRLYAPRQQSAPDKESDEATGACP